MAWQSAVLTLFPEIFPGPLGLSLSGKALQLGLWTLDVFNIRDFSTDKHRTVDDTPAGGGAGMVLRPDVAAACIDHATDIHPQLPRYYLSPRGKPLTQTAVKALAAGPGILLFCGRFEGLDQRVIEARNLIEISIGDYILSGGELAALVMIDACVRLLPGIMGSDESHLEESFENNLLEYPHYTKPREWEGRITPDVLLSGNHERIRQWRREQAHNITLERRPNLLRKS